MHLFYCKNMIKNAPSLEDSTLEKTIENIIEESTSITKKSIKNLHLDMIHQYTNIQLELKKQNEKLQCVIHENERLKEENEFLKSKWYYKNKHYIGNN